MCIATTPEPEELRLADEPAYAKGVRDQCKMLWRYKALRFPETPAKKHALLCRDDRMKTFRSSLQSS